MNKLFETNAKADVPNEPDAQIIFHDMPYISVLQEQESFHHPGSKALK